MNAEQVNSDIRSLIRRLLLMQENSVRPANKNAPTGSEGDQFATVFLTNIAPTGGDDLVRSNVGEGSHNVRETTEGQREVLASINFYRGDAVSKAAKLQTLLSKSRATALMQELGLGLVSTSGVRNLGQTVGTKWEDRAQIDITFYVVASETDNLQTYGEFPFEVSTADVSGNTTTNTFEVFEP